MPETNLAAQSRAGGSQGCSLRGNPLTRRLPPTPARCSKSPRPREPVPCPVRPQRATHFTHSRAESASFEEAPVNKNTPIQPAPRLTKRTLPTQRRQRRKSPANAGKDSTYSGARLGNPHLGPFGLLVKKICTHLYILDFAHLPPLRGTKTKILSPTGVGGGGWRFSLSTLCTRSPRKNAHCRVWLLLLSA